MATRERGLSSMKEDLGQKYLFELDGETTQANPTPAAMAKLTDAKKKGQPARNDSEQIAQFQQALHQIVERLELRLSALEAILARLVEHTATHPRTKEFYTTAEVAQLLGKQPYTVREWCRLGRVRGDKAHSGRGLDEEWRVSHEELVRVQNEGLLPAMRAARITAPRRLPR